MKSLKLPHIRWIIIAPLLFTALALNYLDRQNLPMVITELEDLFSITDNQFARINVMFLIAYGLMYAGGGKITDSLGSKLGFIIIILWWSIANSLHGLVSGVVGLAIARFLLGLGEGGCFPAAAKVVSEWFKPSERSLAFGIFNTGSSMGAVIAPPVIALIMMSLSWQWVFYITGALGFVWVAFWIFLYNHPAKSKIITKEEREDIAQSQAQSIETNIEQRIKWIELFKFRKLWGLLVIKLLTDSAWYFFIFWLPKYLDNVRGLNIKEIGAYAWIPYAFAGAGSLIGGFLSSYLMKKKFTLDKSRKIALGISAFILPASLFIANSPLNLAIIFFATAMFGHQFWSTIVQTLAADIFPSKSVGSVAGLMGAVGCLGALAFQFLSGYLITNFSYTPVFIMAGIFHPVSFFLVLMMIKKIEQVKPI